MKKLLHNTIALVFAAALFFSLTPSASADEPDQGAQESSSSSGTRTIVVGYNDMPGFLYTDSAGNYCGYAYELMQQIGAYESLDFTYKPVSYSNIKKELDEGTIDIYVPHQKSAEREALYEFSSEVFCTNHASLITLPDSDIYYNDFKALDGRTVGVERETRNADRYQQLFTENGISVTMKQEYETTVEMEQALDSGEIDAFICASDRGISHYRIINELDETQSYVLARKGDRSILDQIDKALIEIQQATPLFFNDLEERYRIAEFGSYPSLTRDEADFVEQADAVTVIAGPQDVGSDGEFTGSIGKALELISETTGLKFKAQRGTTSAEMLKTLSQGDADVMFAFDANNAWAELNNVDITVPYASFNGVVIKRADTEDFNELAVVEGSFIAWYAETYYDYQLSYYSSYKECIEKVKAGAADATIVNATYANYYATFPEYSSLIFNTMFDMSNQSSVAVTKDADPRLLSILNKAISAIPDSTLSSLFDAQSGSRQSEPLDVFYQNPVAAFGAVGVLLLLFIAVMFSMIYLRMMRKKNYQLERANRSKDEFLSRMSHELRTPINAISGFAELSKQAIASDLDPNEKKRKLLTYAEDTESSSSYLLSIVNDILDMTKIENNKIVLDLEPISIEHLIERVSAMIEPLAKQKNIEFVFTTIDRQESHFIADGTRIQQILMNLLNNAVKFTPEGGKVELIEKPQIESPGGDVILHYVVRDNGIGMSEEFQKRMFSPFSQESSSSTSTTTGTGLGLPISRRLARLMNGDITCVSVPGQGTTFDVDVQVGKMADSDYPLEAEHVKPIDPESIDLSGALVLLAEDNPINQKVARQLLENKGAQVDVAATGLEAVERFESSDVGHYDIILMDIRMPVMDGYGATKNIRRLDRPDAKTVAIVAMSANAFPDDIEASLKAGMDAHLAKPINVGELYHEVADAKARAHHGM